jgi:hypothetical protein
LEVFSTSSPQELCRMQIMPGMDYKISLSHIL